MLICFYCEILHSGLRNVKFPTNEYVRGKFKTYTSTSTSLDVAIDFRGDKGVVLEFDDELINKIPNCDVSWVSIYKEQEVVFARGVGANY